LKKIKDKRRYGLVEYDNLFSAHVGFEKYYISIYIAHDSIA
jgi:hypothetical protein